jgi:hypothetical protein
MHDKEVPLLAPETRDWVNRLRRGRGEDAKEPYKRSGAHVTVGRLRPLAQNFRAPEDAPAAKAD